MAPAQRPGIPHEPRPLAGLTNSLDGPLFAVAPNGEIVSWDSQATELLGYTRDEVVGRSFFDLLVDAEGAEPTRQAMADALAGGEAWSQVRLRRSDGRTIEVRAQQMALHGTSRHPAVIVVRARDPEVDDHLQALFGTKQRRMALLDAADHLGLGLVVTMDEPVRGPVFSYVNAAACEILGRDLEDLVGTPIHEVVPQEAREQLTALRARTLAGDPGPAVIETEIKRPDGTTVPVEAGWGSGELDGAAATFAFFRDIRERRTALAEADRLRERTRRIDHLAAAGGVVSEIAQELHASITEAAATLHDHRSQLQHEGPIGQDADDLCRSLIDSLWRAQALVQRTGQDLADASTRRPAAQGTPRGLEHHVGRCLDRFERVRPTAVIERHLDPTPPVALREIALDQVVTHLLQNAAEAATTGARLTVRTHRTEEGAQLVVEDAGPGIPVEDLARVFEPFHTTREDALGLGLTMVRTLVEEAGGRVTIDRRTEGGTRVTVELPTREPDA